MLRFLKTDTWVQSFLNPDGSISPAPVNPVNYCPHTDAFMADPNKDAIISQQWQEMQQRNQAAMEAAAAAAAGQ